MSATAGRLPNTFPRRGVHLLLGANPVASVRDELAVGHPQEKADELFNLWCVRWELPGPCSSLMGGRRVMPGVDCPGIMPWRLYWRMWQVGAGLGLLR
jgi:hypothetical protein